MSEAGSGADDQRAAEAEVERFHDQLGPFVVAAETTRMPMVFTNAKAPDNPIVFANDSFLDLMEYEREEVLGQSFNFLMVRGGAQDALRRVEAQFKGEAESTSASGCWSRRR